MVSISTCLAPVNGASFSQLSGFRRCPLLIAHRGESRLAPENTLAAVDLAWAKGARAVEIDVRRSTDDQLLVIHDADLARIGGDRRAVATVSAAEIRDCDAGAWKHRRWTGERVPLLQEALATVPVGGKLFIEIKDGSDCVPPLARALAQTGIGAEQIVVMSFREDTMAAVVAELPEPESCLLVDAREWTKGGGLKRAIDRAAALGCQSLDIQTHRSLDRDVVEAVHDARLRLYVWTVNRVSTAERLCRAGIDGITTDRCAWMREKLQMPPRV